MASAQLAKPIRWLYLIGGFSCVALGYIGLLVPGMPTTVFLILALFAFKRSSPRLESWLLNNRLFGEALRDWDAHRWMSRKSKIIAITMVWVGIGSSILLVHKPTTKGILFAVAAILTIYLLRIRLKPKEAELNLAKKRVLDSATNASNSEQVPL